MSKKYKKGKKLKAKQNQQPKYEGLRQQTKHPATTSVKKSQKLPVIKQLLPIGIILVITYIVFMPALDNGFTNWDDEKYVVKNDLITSFTSERVEYFFKNFYFANYHPLTMVTYLWEYDKVQLDPQLYHRNNLWLHLLNTFLLFFLIYMLTGRVDVSVIVSLLFGIHPMHVESVAWVAERKDVLYTFFYLASLICYVKFIKRKAKKAGFYLLALIFFCLSLLSKAAVVVLPVVMLLIDYLMSRKIKWAVILEKLPFFALSILFGILAVKAQQTTESIADWGTFSFFQRMMFATYGIGAYLFRFFVPLELSCYHPYPFLIGAELRLPYIYYFSPFILLAMFFLVYRSLKRTKIVAFGFLFFLVNVALVLQFVSVGNAVIAERYTYISYIGLFFIVGMGYAWLQEKKHKFRHAVLLALVVGAGIFAYLSHERCKVWENSETLWTDFIKTHPNHHKGYASRGNYYAQNEDYDRAFDDFNMAIKIKPEMPRPYSSRGNIYSMRGQLDLAMADYDKAIGLDPDYPDVYFNRAVTHSINKNYELAFADYGKAIEYDPNNMQAYINRSYAYVEVGSFDEAIADCNTVLGINPNHQDAYLYRGIAYYRKADYKTALNDFNMVLRINPNNGMTYFNRSLCHNSMNNYRSALQDAQKAISLGQQISQEYLNKLKKKIEG